MPPPDALRGRGPPSSARAKGGAGHISTNTRLLAHAWAPPQRWSLAPTALTVSHERGVQLPTSCSVHGDLSYASGLPRRIIS